MNFASSADSYLPAEAGGLERALAAALFEQQHLLRGSLSSDSLPADVRADYEAQLRKASSDLRNLRDSIYQRVSE